MSILIQTGILFFYLINNDFVYSIIIHITGWNYLLCSLYLLLIYICDTSTFLFSSTKFESIIFFLRNKFSHIIFSFCFFITLSYWVMTIPFIYLIFESSGVDIFFHFYLHLGITIIMLIELIFNEREKLKNRINYVIIGILSGIFFIYFILLIILKFKFNIAAYPFMEDFNVLLYIRIVITLYIFVIIGYFINYCLVNWINKNAVKVVHPHIVK